MPDHRCRRDDRCAEAEKIEQRPLTCGECECHLGPGYNCSIPGGCGHLHKPVPTKVGGRIMAEDGLCVTCTGTVTEAISALPADYTDLVVHLSDHGSGMAERVSSSPEFPIPLALPLLTLSEHIAEQAVRWAEPVAEKLNITWDSTLVDRHTRPGVALQRATRLLTSNMPVLFALTEQPGCEWDPTGTYRTWVERSGLDGALELLQCHQSTRMYLRKNKLVHRLPEPCPSCDQEKLVRYDGESQVDCQNPRCRNTWTENDYERLVHILAVEQTEKIREWARRHGLQVADRGRIAKKVMDAYRASDPVLVA